MRNVCSVWHRDTHSPAAKIAKESSRYDRFWQSVSAWYFWMLSVWNAGRSEKVVDRFGSLHPVGHRVCTSKEHYSVVEREYVHRDKLVFLFRSFGMLHYHCQIMDGMAPEEQFLYDIHCIVTSAMVMFGRLVAGDCIPNDEVNSVDMTIRVQVALLCCLLITLKFEGNDIEGFPAVLMLWSMISSDVLQIPTEVTNEVEIICAFEEQILRSVNVFDIVENNHHRVAIECIVKMESEDLIDRQSANRAIALSFFFVSNTYAEAHTHAATTPPTTALLSTTLLMLSLPQLVVREVQFGGMSAHSTRSLPLLEKLRGLPTLHACHQDHQCLNAAGWNAVWQHPTLIALIK